MKFVIFKTIAVLLVLLASNLTFAKTLIFVPAPLFDSLDGTESDDFIRTEYYRIDIIDDDIVAFSCNGVLNRIGQRGGYDYRSVEDEFLRCEETAQFTLADLNKKIRERGAMAGLEILVNTIPIGRLARFARAIPIVRSIEGTIRRTTFRALRYAARTADRISPRGRRVIRQLRDGAERANDARDLTTQAQQFVENDIGDAQDRVQQAWILIQIKNFIDSDDEGRAYPLQSVGGFEADLLNIVDSMED